MKSYSYVLFLHVYLVATKFLGLVSKSQEWFLLFLRPDYERTGKLCFMGNEQNAEGFYLIVLFCVSCCKYMYM